MLGRMGAGQDGAGHLSEGAGHGIARGLDRPTLHHCHKAVGLIRNAVFNQRGMGGYGSKGSCQGVVNPGGCDGVGLLQQGPEWQVHLLYALHRPG